MIERSGDRLRFETPLRPTADPAALDQTIVTQGAPQQSAFGLRFEVLSTIATGSTARVDLCRSLGPRQVGHLIAVKRLLPELIHDETLARRFLDEVWMTAALRDPHVVTVVGWGQDELGPYLASELVQGVSLGRLTKSVIETGEQFAERLVVYIGYCVARGLAAAHELRSERGEALNLVHRDLSAQNVLVGFQGEVKIADFGLAKAKDRLTVTTSELPTRSMGHVSPEELLQRPLDSRSDIFGLGVMLYELLTNKPPFTGRDEIAVLEGVLKQRPAEPINVRTKMDRALSSLVMRCLEKDPAHRPQSAREVAHTLEEWLYVHGYLKDAQESLGRFVRRNSMRQMRWFESIVAYGTATGAQRPPTPPAMNAPAPPPARPQEGFTSASAARVERRDEPTVVAGRKQLEAATPPSAPPPRRTRPSDAPASAKSRRKESTTAIPALPGSPALPFVSGEKTEPTFSDGEDEGDEIPTVAMRMDAKTRAELREVVAKKAAEKEAARKEAMQTGPLQPLPVPRPPPGGRPEPDKPLDSPRRQKTQELGRIDDYDSSQDATVGDDGAVEARLAAELQRQKPPPIRPVEPPRIQGGSARAVTQHVESELSRLRGVAAQRHEHARLAREAAHRAALAAEEAEAAARAIERALAGARAALEVATRGDSASAVRKLEEALAIAGIKP